MNHHLSEIVLLDAAAATGAAQRSQLSARYCFAVAGDFDGATVGLELLGPDGATWIAVEDGSGPLAFTAAAAAIVELPAGSYRATIDGGSDPSLYATLKRVID